MFFFFCPERRNVLCARTGSRLLQQRVTCWSRFVCVYNVFINAIFANLVCALGHT